MFFIVICLVCLVYKEDSNTVPVIFSIRLFGVTLPVDGDAIAVDAIVVCECIGNGSCAFFREREVVCRCTGLSIGVSYDVHLGIRVSLHIFSCVVYADLLTLVDLGRVDAEEHNVGNINRFVDHGRLHFRTFGA